MKTYVLCMLFFISMNTLAQELPIVFMYQVGEGSVVLLNETQGRGDKGILIGATDEILKETMPEGTFANAVNAFLVRIGDENILVDTGFGNKLFDHLRSLGVEADGIRKVLLTHLHGDHIGGMMKNGQPSFPNATVYLSKKEYQYWTSDEEMNKLPANARRGFESARAMLAAYKNNLHLFEPGKLENGGTQLFTGICGVEAYGHTPGHTMYLIDFGNDKFLIWGDLTHALAVQMPYPQVSVTYDVDPVMARESRLAVLKYVAGKQLPVAGMHIPASGMGMVQAKPAGGYRLAPLK